MKLLEMQILFSIKMLSFVNLRIFFKLQLFFFFFLTQNSRFLFAVVAVDVCVCLFLKRGGGRVGEPCRDLGEYGSISCSFNALVFIIHGFSSTLNRITRLLCKDSGLGILIWEMP